MSYEIEITQKAEKEFLKLPPPWQEKTRDKILALEDNPRPAGSKKLKNTPFFRVRAGNYRVIYFINEEKKVIKILAIGHRKDVYR